MPARAEEDRKEALRLDPAIEQKFPTLERLLGD
jgi:hypothetical protein